MALWPWWEATPSVRYEKCPHCGAEQPVEGKKVMVCSCNGARQAELEERERQATWARQQAERVQGRKAKM
jgi:hypothetical protein